MPKIYPCLAAISIFVPVAAIQAPETGDYKVFPQNAYPVD
jgi:hypothetical protein